jgi:hypothetical protein
MVSDSIKLRSSAPDWAEISNHRSRISPFCSNLLPSFLLLELTISSESWRFRQRGFG